MSKRKCGICPVEFDIPTAPTRKERKKYCSLACANLGRARTSAPHRGDIQRGRGNCDTYTKVGGRHEHRAIMEKILGRKLTFDEVVHHKDDNKKNNSIDNLQLMTRSEHTRYHTLLYHKNKKCQNS